MSMNKKEQAAMASLQEQLQRAKAFRFTEEVPFDIPAPNNSSRVVNGWSFNLHTQEVYKSCSTSHSHGWQWSKTSSQGPRHQFSSELLATRALRCALEEKFSKELAVVDKRINQLTGDQNEQRD